MVRVVHFDPVKIRVKVRDDLFYTIKIRNDDYAREFAMLNNLTPHHEFLEMEKERK